MLPAMALALTIPALRLEWGGAICGEADDDLQFCWVPLAVDFAEKVAPASSHYVSQFARNCGRDYSFMIECLLPVIWPRAAVGAAEPLRGASK
jgi:hypothetical protein